MPVSQEHQLCIYSSLEETNSIVEFLGVNTLLFQKKKFLTDKYFENEILVLHRSNSIFIMHIF